MPADYHIEHAKSSKSSCKKCKEKIQKDEIRIGISSMKGDIKITGWNHPSCFTIPRTIKVNAEEFVNEYLEDQTADGILDDPDFKQRLVIQISSTPKKKEEKHDNPIANRIASYKTAFEELPDEDEDDDEETRRPTKKAKKGGDPKILNAAAKAYGIYHKMKNPELQDVLRWNVGYGMTGTKDALLLRCIDGHVNGRLARCPMCFRGKLQLADKDAGQTVACGGYFDEEISARIPCTYVAKNERAPRLQPWYAEKPTEEQTEEIKKITEEHEAKASGGGGGGSGGAPVELLKLANDLDWPDISTMAGKKEAANLMAELCTSGDVTVDLPQDEKKARMACGKIIVGHPEASASQILELIVKEYGVSSNKLALAEKQKDAIAESCNCPANAGIMQAFLELGNLYLKEGNANAAGAYKRAATAIMGLDFEITADNAKGLCKGKTKVANIGKGSADKMYEFFTTGTIEKLEEKRTLSK
mmetsp:Transcript_19864/g.41056  ORF Transcript_19864/g.41056 Transcript_19864/m.41056 type:complete len:474 (+) Transcript_19864:186-1607(+)